MFTMRSAIAKRQKRGGSPAAAQQGVEQGWEQEQQQQPPLTRELTEAQVLQAVEGRRADILAHAATVSTNLLLRWVRQDLGLPPSDAAAAAALHRHRQAARQHALELLEEQGQVPASVAAASAADLPPELLPAIYRWLDHDSLFSCLQVSRAWRAAGAGPLAENLWEELCGRRGWAAPQQPPAQQQDQDQQDQPPQEQQAQHAQQTEEHEPQMQGQPMQEQGKQGPSSAAAAAHGGPAAGEAQQEEEPPAPAPDWRRVYSQRYALACYDCFQPTLRHTLRAGSLRLRLCRRCSAGYDSPRPAHRLLSRTTAKWQCCLKDADLAPLPRCVEPNPANASFQPMDLFRRLDVRQAAISRWGSWEAAQAEHRRRITRG